VAGFLDDEARRGFKQAIETIEGASSAEVVIAIRRRSATYRHANVVIGAIAAFAGLAIALFADDEFSLLTILIDPFVLAGLAGAAVELVPGVKRLLTPASWRRRELVRAARATFVERGVHNTRDRTGILVYISQLERQIALVFDSGIERKLSPEIREAAERTLSAALPRGGAAVANALGELASALASAAPARADDINELPDAIDSDQDASA
jgi:putative membrane protein